jgi:hypothetical protein
MSDEHTRYMKITKLEVVRFLLEAKAREADLNTRLQASTDEQGRMASKRQTDEAKIHQLQTALDAAVRARTQALEDLQKAQQRSYYNDSNTSKLLMLEDNLKDVRAAMGLLNKVIK